MDCEMIANGKCIYSEANKVGLDAPFSWSLQFSTWISSHIFLHFEFEFLHSCCVWDSAWYNSNFRCVYFFGISIISSGNYLENGFIYESITHSLTICMWAYVWIMRANMLIVTLQWWMAGWWLRGKVSSICFAKSRFAHFQNARGCVPVHSCLSSIRGTLSYDSVSQSVSQM